MYACMLLSFSDLLSENFLLKTKANTAAKNRKRIISCFSFACCFCSNFEQTKYGSRMGIVSVSVERIGCERVKERPDDPEVEEREGA